MHHVFRPRCTLGALLSLLPLIAGCAPVFSDLQSARLVGKGRVEATPSFSALYFTNDGTDHVENHAGVQLATGIADRVDLRLRYERVFDPGVNVVGFGPKIALVRDRLALALPVGFAFGSEIDSSKSWEIHPTLIATAPLGRKAEWNSSFKVMIPLSGGEGNDTLLAVNTGFGLSSNLDRWVLRPEVGMCFNPGDKGHFTQASVGLTVFLGPDRPRN